MHKTIFAISIALLLLTGCSDDTDKGAVAPGTDTGADTQSDTGDTGSGTPDTAPDMSETPDLGMDAEDASDVEDVTEDPADVPEDTSDADTSDAEDAMDVEDEPDAPGPVMQACDEDTPCPDGYECVEGVCTLVPSGNVYVENNYQLLRPTALTNVLSFFKGIFTDLGFFMTAMDPLDGDTILVHYGGADRVNRVMDGPDEWRWQLPDRLPTYTMRRATENVDALQSNTWISEVFTYRLVALYGDEPRAGIGFTAEETVVTMRFNEELTDVVEGTIRGYITREEAENRRLEISDNCLLQQGACPAVDCENAPLESLADVLDCNEVDPDYDLDDEIPGNDAYTTEIYFTSEIVTLVE